MRCVRAAAPGNGHLVNGRLIAGVMRLYTGSAFLTGAETAADSDFSFSATQDNRVWVEDDQGGT